MTIKIFVSRYYSNENKSDMNDMNDMNDNKQLLMIDVSLYESIYSLKRKIYLKLEKNCVNCGNCDNRNNYDIDNQILHFAGNNLNNSECIGTYNITTGSTIFLTLESEKLNGGGKGTVLYYALLIFAYLFFFFILITGFLPIAAHLYDILLKYPNVAQTCGNVSAVLL